jgi:hypothetical protein
VPAMSEPLTIQLSVVYEEIEDGWTMATIPEFPAAIRQAARDKRRARTYATRELLLSHGRTGEPPPAATGSKGEPLELTIAVKRRDLERHLASRGCEVLREGGGHTIWRNAGTGAED